MNLHILILIIIILFIGIFSGSTSFLQKYFREDTPKINEIWKYILTSIGASLLVPLLLNMLSSNLIIHSKDYELTNYFVFAGFCFIAGYYSDKFIYTIADKVLQNLEKNEEKIKKIQLETDENEEKIESLFSSDIESDEDINEDELKENIDIKEFEKSDVLDLTKTILRAFIGKYKFRSLKGISKEINKDEVLLLPVFNQLERFNLLKRIITKSGKTVWMITSLGKRMLD